MSAELVHTERNVDFIHAIRIHGGSYVAICPQWAVTHTFCASTTLLLAQARSYIIRPVAETGMVWMERGQV